MKRVASADDQRSAFLLRLVFAVAAAAVAAGFAGPGAAVHAQADKNAKPPAEVSPIIEGVFPPSVRLGETQRIAIVGKSLERIDRCLVSGEGVEAKLTSAATAAKVEIEVTARPDAAPGCREFRMAGASGITNLMILRIDHLWLVLVAGCNDTLT